MSIRARLFSNASQTYSNPTFTGVVTGVNTSGTTIFKAGLDGSTNPINGFYSSYFSTNNHFSAYDSAANALAAGAIGRGTYITNALIGTSTQFGLASGDPSSTSDTRWARVAANGVVWGTATAAAGSVTSRTEINKAVTAFTDAAAKTVFTVTVPNAAHHAVLEVEIQGALGVGGAIGAGEAMATNTYKIAIVRTAGVATVATATAATHAVAVAVAGAATVTATAAVSAIAGAVGATQTFTIDVTITKSGGASDNHTCLAYAKLMNANATGITIS